MSLLILKTTQELQLWRKNQGTKTIGFVPTMGALHEGHEVLLNMAKNNNDLVVLSIFVNPTQFNDKKDFEKYPSTWSSDLKMAKKNNVDIIFYPNYDQIYPDEYKYKVIETDFSHKLCGKSRPGHFDGVLTVVMKLLNLVQPTRAYFGEKDFQQLSLVKGMIEAFFLPYDIISVSTVREKDGLAMSSRNTRLTSDQRRLAPEIYSHLKSKMSVPEVEMDLEKLGLKVDYIEEQDERRYAAVFLGEVRLIDNVKISSNN